MDVKWWLSEHSQLTLPSARLLSPSVSSLVCCTVINGYFIMVVLMSKAPITLWYFVHELSGPIPHHFNPLFQVVIFSKNQGNLTNQLTNEQSYSAHNAHNRHCKKMVSVLVKDIYRVSHSYLLTLWKHHLDFLTLNRFRVKQALHRPDTVFFIFEKWIFQSKELSRLSPSRPQPIVITFLFDTLW